jgi:hypothetical protein
VAAVEAAAVVPVVVVAEATVVALAEVAKAVAVVLAVAALAVALKFHPKHAKKEKNKTKNDKFYM